MCVCVFSSFFCCFVFFSFFFLLRKSLFTRICPISNNFLFRNEEQTKKEQEKANFSSCEQPIFLKCNDSIFLQPFFFFFLIQHKFYGNPECHGFCQTVQTRLLSTVVLVHLNLELLLLVVFKKVIG